MEGYTTLGMPPTLYIPVYASICRSPPVPDTRSAGACTVMGSGLYTVRVAGSAGLDGGLRGRAYPRRNLSKRSIMEVSAHNVRLEGAIIGGF